MLSLDPFSWFGGGSGFEPGGGSFGGGGAGGSWDPLPPVSPWDPPATLPPPAQPPQINPKVGAIPWGSRVYFGKVWGKLPDSVLDPVKTIRDAAGDNLLYAASVARSARARLEEEKQSSLEAKSAVLPLAQTAKSKVKSREEQLFRYRRGEISYSTFVADYEIPAEIAISDYIWALGTAVGMAGGSWNRSLYLRALKAQDLAQRQYEYWSWGFAAVRDVISRSSGAKNTSGVKFLIPAGFLLSGWGGGDPSESFWPIHGGDAVTLAFRNDDSFMWAIGKYKLRVLNPAVNPFSSLNGRSFWLFRRAGQAFNVRWTEIIRELIAPTFSSRAPLTPNDAGLNPPMSNPPSPFEPGGGSFGGGGAGGNWGDSPPPSWSEDPPFWRLAAATEVSGVVNFTADSENEWNVETEESRIIEPPENNQRIEIAGPNSYAEVRVYMTRKQAGDGKLGFPGYTVVGGQVRYFKHEQISKDGQTWQHEIDEFGDDVVNPSDTLPPFLSPSELPVDEPTAESATVWNWRDGTALRLSMEDTTSAMVARAEAAFAEKTYEEVDFPPSQLANLRSIPIAGRWLTDDETNVWLISGEMVIDLNVYQPENRVRDYTVTMERIVLNRDTFHLTKSNRDVAIRIEAGETSGQSEAISESLPGSNQTIYYRVADIPVDPKLFFKNTVVCDRN